MDQEEGSWLESRRLILTQLSVMSEAIKNLAEKIDRQSDIYQTKISNMMAEHNSAISDLKVRLAMLEVSAKIWGGMIGLLTGGVATFVINLVLGHIKK